MNQGEKPIRNFSIDPALSIRTSIADPVFADPVSETPIESTPPPTAAQNFLILVARSLPSSGSRAPRGACRSVQESQFLRIASATMSGREKTPRLPFDGQDVPWPCISRLEMSTTCFNKLKTTPTPNKNGLYGIKGGFVRHKSRSLYAIKVGSCTTFSVKVPLFQGIFTPYDPSFYGIFQGHIFC